MAGVIERIALIRSPRLPPSHFYQVLTANQSQLEAQAKAQAAKLEKLLKDHQQLLKRHEEYVERQRHLMHQSCDDEELDELRVLFNSPKVLSAMRGNSRMMAFWTDQLR